MVRLTIPEPNKVSRTFRVFLGSKIVPRSFQVFLPTFLVNLQTSEKPGFRLLELQVVDTGIATAIRNNCDSDHEQV
jgi:hypothetical protein